MTVSRTRWILAGVASTVLLLAPMGSGAQSAAQNETHTDRNLTQQAQNEINIVLPSFAPLVDRVVPSVVNISVELKEQAAVQDEGTTGQEGASPFGESGTPFDQSCIAFSNSRSSSGAPRKRSWHSAPGS